MLPCAPTSSGRPHEDTDRRRRRARHRVVRTAGAALDVFEEEPLSLDSALRNLGDKVLLSPPMVSSNVGSGLGPGIRWATESVLHALHGEVPDNVDNKDVIPRWQSRFGGRSVWAAT